MSCRPVTTVSQSAECSSDWPVTARASPDKSHYLSSFVAVQRGLGSPGCPWRIEADPGRRINLTLIDFATPTAADHPTVPGGSSSPGGTDGFQFLPTSRICYQYATVNERPGVIGATMMLARSFAICGGDRRERHISVSTSSMVDVQVSRRNAETDRDFYFLVQYRGQCQ